jgi:hypothetical protein
LLVSKRSPGWRSHLDTVAAIGWRTTLAAGERGGEADSVESDFGD